MYGVVQSTGPTWLARRATLILYCTRIKCDESRSMRCRICFLFLRSHPHLYTAQTHTPTHRATQAPLRAHEAPGRAGLNWTTNGTTLKKVRTLDCSPRDNDQQGVLILATHTQNTPHMLYLCPLIQTYLFAIARGDVINVN